MVGSPTPGNSGLDTVRSHDWPALLSRVIAGEGLRSYYQPIVDVARGAVVGYEALARFIGPPVADPETWFTAARQHGRLAALEAAALRSALACRSELPSNTFLTVNLGPDVLDAPEVRQVLDAEPGLAGVVVELTEHAALPSYGALQPALDRLRDAGAALAIDDTGSGYAGLQHLLDVRPDFIKLDRGLVSGLDRDEAQRSLVEMIGVLASRLDAWLIAEGVETRAELDCLALMEVPLVQGYLLARPDAPWPQIDPALSRSLRRRSEQRHPDTLRALLEMVPVVTESRAANLSAQDTDLVVVIDESSSRPMATLDGTGLLRPLVGSMRVNLDTDIAEAAQRAIARPRGQSMEPLVCIDNAGRYVGVVRMERIVGMLAARPGQPRTDTTS